MNEQDRVIEELGEKLRREQNLAEEERINHARVGERIYHVIPFVFRKITFLNGQ